MHSNNSLGGGGGRDALLVLPRKCADACWEWKTYKMGKNAVDYNKPLAVKRMNIKFPKKLPQIQTQATIPPAISYCRQNAEYPNILWKPLRTPANLYGNQVCSSDIQALNESMFIQFAPIFRLLKLYFRSIRYCLMVLVVYMTLISLWMILCHYSTGLVHEAHN